MNTDLSFTERMPRRCVRWYWAALLCSLTLPVMGFTILSFALPFPMDKLESFKRRHMSTIVLDREGTLLRAFPGKDHTWLFWVSLDDISPRLIEATIAVEDERFFYHWGVDPIAVVRAFWSNLRRGRVVSGASTITMQIIRMMDKRPRTLTAKIVEAFRAFQLERILSKREILELYLNLGPYGGNLVGVEAASLAYFRKHAKDLTLGEAALLAGLVQAPSRLRPDRHPVPAQRRRAHVLRRLYVCGYITSAQLEIALREPVLRVTRTPFPFDAPHLAQIVRQRFPRQAVLRTTLDHRIQTVAEHCIRDEVNRLRPGGVSNGAVVVIENATAAVRALVGSCDFFSVKDQGQINGAIAPRSPGSTLKPFIYALAFEQGVVTPESILQDTPYTYVAYQPKNYDNRFRGPVTAREALWASLNVPAVVLLQKVGQKKVYSLLKNLGLSTLKKDAGYYGLSFALGSADVTLLELTNAYAALARLGEHRPYRLLECIPVRPGSPVLTPAAAWLVADILSDMSRVPVQVFSQFQRNRLRMAWKTGTSYGHRDAWTIVYTPEYTVGVWMGNFSGKSAHGLVGIEAAAPVAFRIMEQIYGDKIPSWYPQPSELNTRTVCANSGLLATSECRAVRTDYYIRGVSLERVCFLHAPFQRAREEQPRIVSPLPNQIYVLIEEDAASHQVLLKATSEARQIHWFIDGVHYRACAPHEPVFWPLQPGRHKIVCADEAGRYATVQIVVQ